MQAPLAELRELLDEAAGLPASMPEVEHLQALIERGEAWKRQMQAALAGRTNLKKVRACSGWRRGVLRCADPDPSKKGAAAGSPMSAPLTPACTTAACAPGCALLQLREVLNAGLRLPVELPEVEDLRQVGFRVGRSWMLCVCFARHAAPPVRLLQRSSLCYHTLAICPLSPLARLQEVRRREWDDAARRALSSRANTLAALNELAAVAVELGAEDTQLAAALR